MHPVYTVAAIRVAEHAAMAELPENTLMQRAAFGMSVDLAEVMSANTGKISGQLAVGLIGPGNNGSDTLWALSLLAKRGVGIRAIDVTGLRHKDHTDQVFDTSGGQWWSLADLHERATSVDVVIDGIAGLGTSRAVAPEIVEVVHHARAAGALIVATDLPSGVVVDTGAIIDPHGVIHADLTVTFGALKGCHVLDPALEACGEIWLVEIGIEDYLEPASMFLFDGEDTAVAFAEPLFSDNKYSRGVVGIVAGSTQYPGAGVLTARAARWGGAGMVRHIGGEMDNEAPSVIPGGTFEEAILDKRITSWLVGPGIGTDENQSAMISQLLSVSAPVVIDADAITVIAQSAELQHQLRTRNHDGKITVLTPHWGEARTLAKGLDVQLSDVGLIAAQQLSVATSTVVYLKGSIGIVATPEGQVVVTDRMSPHLSTAGSGDVLAGLLASVLAHHQQPTSNMGAARCVAAAVQVHSAAAEIIAEKDEPVVAEGIEQQIPVAIAEFRESVSPDYE